MSPHLLCTVLMGVRCHLQQWTVNIPEYQGRDSAYYADGARMLSPLKHSGDFSFASCVNLMQLSERHSSCQVRMRLCRLGRAAGTPV